MEINKRDYIWLGLLILVIIIVSPLVEDSRAMTPPAPTLAETSARKVNRKINTAHYLVYEDAIEEAIEEVVEEEIVEEVIEEVVEEEVVEEVVEPAMTYLGTFEITAYEWTGNPCANGNYPTEWYTVACNSLPFGTTVYIENIGYFVVEDRGASWHSDNWLDIYMGDELECYHWGRQYHDVYLVN